MTEHDSRHVVLVGLMGVGKTTVGRRLAKELDRPFADTDEHCELRAGRTVRHIFREQGEATFRALEADVLHDLLAGEHPIVVAAGGGTVLAESNRAVLRKRAYVIWLHADPSFIGDRIDVTTRPLLDGDRDGTLQRLFEERAPIYREVADAVYDVQPVYEADLDKPKRVVASALADLVRSRATVS